MSETSNIPSLNEILVVDDIEANRSLLQETLESKGYEVLLASNGESALEIAQSVVPAAVLLDVNMPGMDGFQTCRALKSSEITRHIPVIFITANDGTVMEMHPRPVDLSVDTPIGESYLARDSQLEAAVRELLKELGSRSK